MVVRGGQTGRRGLLAFAWRNGEDEWRRLWNAHTQCNAINFWAFSGAVSRLGGETQLRGASQQPRRIRNLKYSSFHVLHKADSTSRPSSNECTPYYHVFDRVAPRNSGNVLRTYIHIIHAPCDASNAPDVRQPRRYEKQSETGGGIGEETRWREHPKPGPVGVGE